MPILVDAINKSYIMNIIQKVWRHRRDLRSIFKSIYFNFHYLPFRQAIHLPILLYKPRFFDLKGQIRIVGKDVKYGMVRLGYPIVSIYPNSGIMIENHGGTIVFNGLCSIGNNSSISVGKKGYCEFGAKFAASTTFKLVCYHDIRIGDRCRFGWDCMIMDSDMHKLTKINGGYSKGYAPIRIGVNNWFGNGCLVMKRSETPDYCTISARTILSGKVDAPKYSVIGQKCDAEVIALGLWRNMDNDIIDYKECSDVGNELLGS